MPRLNSIWTRLVINMAPSGDPARRRDRRSRPRLDGLEGRVVLSRFGFGGPGLLGRAAFAQRGRMNAGTGNAVATPPTNTTDTSRLGGLARGLGAGRGDRGLPGAQDAQLTSNLQKLQADTRVVFEGSAVTDAQRNALATDLRALRNASVAFDRTALGTVADNLLKSLANGSYDQDASALQAAFASAFSGLSGAALTSDQSALVTTAYNDFATVARDLNVDAAELQTLADDRAAIQADLTRLGIGTTEGQGPGQSSNLELILQGPGPRGGGPGRGPGGGPGFGRHGGRRF
jgi:hypothetical protein